MRGDRVHRTSDGKMKSCQAKQEDLKAYLDGELTRFRRIALSWHLLRCAGCREALTTMTEISRRLAVRKNDALDPDLRARILSSVNYAEARQASPGRANRRRRWHPLLLGGATAAGLLVIVMASPLFVQVRERAGSRSHSPAISAYMPPANQKAAAPAANSGPKPAAADRDSAMRQATPAFAEKSPAKQDAMPQAKGASVQGYIETAQPASAPTPVREQKFKGVQNELIITDGAARRQQYFNGVPPERQHAAGQLKQQSVPSSASSYAATTVTQGGTAHVVANQQRRKGRSQVLLKAAKSKASQIQGK